jgi:hypothetical protein
MVEHPFQDVSAPTAFLGLGGQRVNQGANDQPAECRLLMVFVSGALQ